MGCETRNVNAELLVSAVYNGVVLYSTEISVPVYGKSLLSEIAVSVPVLSWLIRKSYCPLTDNTRSFTGRLKSLVYFNESSLIKICSKTVSWARRPWCGVDFRI